MEEFETEVIALTASTGPVAPFLQAGSAPLRLPSYLHRLNEGRRRGAHAEPSRSAQPGQVTLVESSRAVGIVQESYVGRAGSGRDVPDLSEIPDSGFRESTVRRVKAQKPLQNAVASQRAPTELEVAKGADKLTPKLLQENPRNLIPTQTRSEMSGSQVKRLTKDMKQNGFDLGKPVDAWRNPSTGRLEIQDGHHRTEAARKAGLGKIPVQVWE